MMKAKTTRRAIHKAEKAIKEPKADRKATAAQLSDSEIEEKVLDLIEEHFDEKHRNAACKWLMGAAAFYRAFLEKEAQLLDSGSPTQ